MKKLHHFLVLAATILLFSTNESRDLNIRNVEVDSGTTRVLSNNGYPINWPQYDGFHQTGKVVAEYNCFGTFGSKYNRELPIWDDPLNAPSFVTPPNSNVEYLFGGGFWIGGIVNGDTIVSVGHDGWQFVQEFSPPTYNSDEPVGTMNEIGFIADYSLRCAFTDTVPNSGNSYYPGDSFNPLNLKIANRSHAWHSDPENNCIIYDVVFTNVGTETINSGYFGLYFDCDVGTEPQVAYTDDVTGTVRSEGIAYIIDNDGDQHPLQTPATKIFAFKFLYNSFSASDTNYNWWIANGNPVLDFGPRQKGTPEKPYRDYGTGGVGTPEGDPNKYYILSFDEWDYDQIYTWSISNNDSIWLTPNPTTSADFSDGFDTRFLFSTGPFDLLPDSSARVIFSTFTADSVHTDPAILYNLPANPDNYLAQLNFDNVLSNASIADSLGLLLLDPYLPVLGLEYVEISDSSGELQWDPWGTDGVNGYELIYSELVLDTLPYPGVVPIWWGPTEPITTVQIPKTYRFTLEGFDPDKQYVAEIAHGFGLVKGEYSQPIHFKINPRDPAPEVPARHAFANPEGPLKLRWKSPDKDNVDHFNIYKFPDSQSANRAYHAVYDYGGKANIVEPKDSFFIDGQTYYYYAMEPYAVIDGNDTLFYDANPIEGEVYRIASADEYGFESEYTELIFANIVDEVSRDILVITNSPVVTSQNYSYSDSIFSFYDKILQGFDYEFYDYRDSTIGGLCLLQDEHCMDWHDFMKFKLVIVDDRYSEFLFRDDYQDSTDGFVRYVSYGGKLAYFGRFRQFHGQNFNGYPDYIPSGHNFIQEMFGIDSISYGGERYYWSHSSPPFVDSLFGFFQANSYQGLVPTVTFDFTRDPFTHRIRNYWTPETPPGVASFKTNEKAERVQSFNSVYSSQSLQQDEIVGVRREYTGLDTYAYAFGYHLWYMDTADARDLVETILSASPMNLSSQTNVEPQEYHYFEAFTVDSSSATIILGNLSHERIVSEISEETITINDSIKPVEFSIVTNHPNYNGEVLTMKVLLRELLTSYGPIYGHVFKTYSLSGNLDDGMAFHSTGIVHIIGHLRGDFNDDEAVNVLDLNLLVGYLFREQPLPENALAADIVWDNAINILDLTRLVNFIFREGTLD